MSPRQRRVTSRYICLRCEIPLQRNGPGFRHAVNAATRDLACGQAPLPLLRVDKPLVPGMWVEIWRPAGFVTIDGIRYAQRFRAGSFNHLVGKIEEIRRSGRVVAQGVIVAAKVPADGSGVSLSIEITRGERAAA